MKDHFLKRGNLLWESSRMMLPEHREQLLDHRSQQKKKVRPRLADDELELLARELTNAYQEGYVARVTEFDEWEDRVYEGRITRIDQTLRRIKIEQEKEEDGPIWLPLDGIIKMEKAE